MFDFPSSPTVGQIFAPAGGPSWAWDGVAWKNTSSEAELQIVRTFIPGGSAAAVTYTYNKPANLRHLEFEGVAAGGSAGPAIATAASTWSFASSGGGGAWGKKLFQAAALPASVLITIGAPGAGVSNGNGNDAAATTFGSLITLPGGLKGFQGSNTLYSSYSTISGSGWNNYPTGVDVGSCGESSDASIVSVSASYPATGPTAMVGKAGGSPWGKGYPSWWGSGGNSNGGIGYGWGSGAPLNAGGAALRSSVAGGPGAVLLTEYLITEPGPAYVTADELNRVVNGAMQHNLEGNGVVTATSSYPVDQFYLSFTGPVVNAQQIGSLTTQRGRQRIRSTVTTPKVSLAASDVYGILTSIEGYSINDAVYGSTAAKQMVLQFGFKGPAGTYAVAIRNAAANRSFAKGFTISAGEANADTLQTIVIPGCTDGTWNTDLSLGMSINFQFAAGSSLLAPTDGVWSAANYVGVTGMSNGAAAANTFEIFDVGLYLDPGNTGVAPPFKIPDYATELARCQRYWTSGVGWPICAGYAGAGGGFYMHLPFPVKMRVNPTITFSAQSPSNAGALGSLALGVDGFRCGATATGAGGAYVTFNFTANARM